jgi:hypothetical protein
MGEGSLFAYKVYRLCRVWIFRGRKTSKLVDLVALGLSDKSIDIVDIGHYGRSAYACIPMHREPLQNLYFYSADMACEVCPVG